MKTLRHTNFKGGIARLVEHGGTFKALLIINGEITETIEGDDANKVWNGLIKGEAKKITRQSYDADKYHEVANIVENTKGAIYLTGRAGTGKTTFLKNFLNNTELKAVIIAPTGIAALNAGGQTAHSLFKLPPSLIRPQDIKRVREGRILRAIDIMVIDEVSMVRSDLMDAIDRSLRLHRGVAKPFGGVRLLCVGDNAQLPPVVKNDEIDILEEWFGGPYFFNSPSARLIDWTVIELCHAFRQTEERFLEILNRVRGGKITRDDYDLLEDRINNNATIDVDNGVILTTTNEAAKRINDKEMAALPDKGKIYQCDVDGVFDEKLFPTEGDLNLKIGAKVMILRNDADKRWVNGTLATIVDLLKDSVKVKIGRHIHEIETAEWERYAYELDENNEPKRKTVGVFRQLPIRPAWALTIHKAQGLTFDRVHVDFGRGAFAHGQTYVALSRCRTLEGLTISRNLKGSDIIIEKGASYLFDKANFSDFGAYRMGKIEIE